MVDELSAEYWISLVGKLTHMPDAADVITRHKVSLDRIQWIHGLAWADLRDIGVRIYFWKPGSGRKADVYVHGVEFVLQGMRKGKPYQGSLPHGIDWSDSIDAINAKLAPTVLVDSHIPGYLGAHLPDHRLSIRIDAKQALKSCTWISNMEMRRIPSPAAVAAMKEFLQ